MLEDLKFHHIGIAVKNFEKSLSYYQRLGYKRLNQDIVRDNLHKVDLILLQHDSHPDIELVSPFDNNSPIGKYLKNSDVAMYHLCYEVDDFDYVVNSLKKEFRVFSVVKPKPAILFNNRLVAFYYLHGIGLIELLIKHEI
jgi:methylmalonyl-CoA/ethylmalonyl-CoA epimerase